MKQTKQKRITNRDLLETMKTRFLKVDQKHESLLQTMTEGFDKVYKKIDESQEELARMVAVGFEQTATKQDLESVRQELKQDIGKIEFRFNPTRLRS